MKALMFQQPNQAEVVEAERPEIGPDEILVASRAVGVCHSDFDLLSGRYIIPISFPTIPGHEWSGEVAEVGREVTSFKPGDRVVGECVIGDDHFGFSISGAAAEYFKVRPEWLHKLPDELSYAYGALVEPFTVAYYAVQEARNVNASDLVAVLGAGPIGLCCLAAAKGHGADVVVIDPVAERRAIAESMGATATLEPGEGLEERFAALAGEAPQVIIEASGNPLAMASAVDLAGFRSRLVYVGIETGDSAPAFLGQIQSKELSIRGVIGSPNVWPAALRFLARGGIDLDAVITASFPLERATEALDAARRTDENVKVQMVSEESAR
jgi:L-iditol 2-dehydrogenase